MARESWGEYFLSPNRWYKRWYNSESDPFSVCFTVIRDGVEWLSGIVFNPFCFCQLIASSALWKKNKLICFPLHSLYQLPHIRVLIPSQLTLFLFLRIASHSWLNVDQHPHTGTRECTDLLYWLKVLVWWAWSKSPTSWLPALAEFASGEENIPWICVCLLINILHFTPTLEWGRFYQVGKVWKGIWGRGNSRHALLFLILHLSLSYTQTNLAPTPTVRTGISWRTVMPPITKPGGYINLCLTWHWAETDTINLLDRLTLFLWFPHTVIPPYLPHGS